MTDKALDELINLNPRYPVNNLKSLIGKEYKTFTILRENIQKEIFENETGTEEDKKTKAKSWVLQKYKNVIYKYSNKKLNESLIFLSIGVDNLEEYLEESFSIAYQKLLNPETLKYKNDY